jgi:predicted TPR repeat methyltransferase
VSDGDGSDSRIATPDRQFDIRLPSRNAEDYDQDQEWCDVHLDGEVRRIRFHDYHEVYEIPGLYEQIFYTELRCDSPRTIAALLDEAVKGDGGSMSDLSVLDVGAGNGMVGEELDRRGVESIVGVDIIEEALEATQRDRPGIYDAYHVVDLTDIPEDARRELEKADFNCLVTVAALGFGDIPPEAFKAAYDLVEDGGWIAFNIKEDFIADGDGSGFSQMVDRAFNGNAMRVKGKRRYRHRDSVAGEPLYYVGIVAEKQGELEL